MNKKLRYWSDEEIRAITPFIISGEKLTEENTAEFRKKYDRSLMAMYNYVYTRRRESMSKRRLKRKTNSYYLRKKLIGDLVPKESKTTDIKELKVPIKDISIIQDVKGLSLIIKF
jgi:hypothetical protein